MRVNGPVPKEATPVLKSSVVASTNAESIIAILDMSFGVKGSGFFVDTRSVKSSIISNSLPFIKVAKLEGLLGTFAARFIVATTSSAVNAAPLWNLTPALNLNSQELSPTGFQDSARPGINFWLTSCRTSALYTCVENELFIVKF